MEGGEGGSVDIMKMLLRPWPVESRQPQVEDSWCVRYVHLVVFLVASVQLLLLPKSPFRPVICT